MHGIAGFERWDEFGNLTEGQLRRGFGPDDVRRVIGGNFRRVFQRVLG